MLNESKKNFQYNINVEEYKFRKLNNNYRDIT